jgi:Zn finger protein HypA/HybF involved in hydrogenase expression
MRWRLLTAVRELLRDPSVSGLPDVARLAAVVLFAKSRASNGRTRIWAAELGRWLGVSESTVDHAVLPRLRASKALQSQVITGASGQVTGLECVVMPAWRAKRKAEQEGDVSQPLALSRRELATLLRLCEALFGPGWAPANSAATPPGLLAERRGRGAATDRLGLLLMVLETRADGWLRLCGGSVDKRRGRAAATVARALGCSASAGGKVLERLQKHGLVEVVRKETESGLQGSSRVRIAAVAAAHGRDRRAAGSRSSATHRPGGGSQREERLPLPAARQGSHAPGGEDSGSAQTLEETSAQSPAEPNAAALSDLPGAAPGDLDRVAGADSPAGAGASQGHWRQDSAESDLPAAAPLHASHPSVADLSEEGDGCGSLSGVAVWGVAAVGRDARARANMAGAGSTAARSAASGADALRAENTKPSRLSQRPGDLTIRGDVNQVLTAITPVRERLADGQLRVAQAAIGAVLRVMPVSGLISHLESRLAPISFEFVAGQTPEMRSPLGWLLSQLPKVSLCPRCDRTFNGTRAGVQLCGQCAVSAGQARHVGWCDDCGQQRTLDANRLCQRCHNDRVKFTACGSCGSRALVDAITGFCRECEYWLREFCAPELAGLNADGQKLALRLLRGPDPEAPKQRKTVPASEPAATPKWKRHWRKWAERPLPEDQDEPVW